MDLHHAVLVAAAGWAAGVINTIAGAGSLLTFPALLAAGLPPLAANVSNCIGVVPGSVSGAYGLRAELRGQTATLRRWGGSAAAGSTVGAVVLLNLPSSSFDRVVPVLVGAAGLLVLAQPLVARAARQDTTAAATPGVTPDAGGGTAGPPEPGGGAVSRWTTAVVAVLGVYAGYFGAAIGVLLIGTLGLLAPRPLRQLNAQKNVVAAAANATAGVIYAVFAPVNWLAVLLLSLSSAAGGPVGALLARRVPAGPLRVLIAAVSLVVAVRLALRAW